MTTAVLILLKKTAVAKRIKLTITIVAPVGRSRQYDIAMPDTTEITAERDEITKVARKLFDNCRAVTGGSMMSADISMIPTTFMDKTTVTAAINTNIVLTSLEFIPEATADSSSKVKEKRSLKWMEIRKITSAERISERTTSVLLMERMLPKR